MKGTLKNRTKALEDKIKPCDPSGDYSIYSLRLISTDWNELSNEEKRKMEVKIKNTYIVTWLTIVAARGEEQPPPCRWSNGELVYVDGEMTDPP